MPNVSISINQARDCNDANPGHVGVNKGGVVTFKNMTGYVVDLNFGTAPVSPSSVKLAAPRNSSADVTVDADAAPGEYDYSISGGGKPECDPPGNKPSMVVN